MKLNLHVLDIFIAPLFSIHVVLNDSNKEFPANDIVRANKFDDLQNRYLRTIISVCHACIIKYCFYKLK
jgi:hypothetical protein